MNVDAAAVDALSPRFLQNHRYRVAAMCEVGVPSRVLVRDEHMDACFYCGRRSSDSRLSFVKAQSEGYSVVVLVCRCCRDNFEARAAAASCRRCYALMPTTEQVVHCSTCGLTAMAEEVVDFVSSNPAAWTRSL